MDVKKLLNGRAYSVRSVASAGLTPEESKRIIDDVRDLYLWFSPDSDEAAMHRRFHLKPESQIDLLYDEQGVCAGFTTYFTQEFEGKLVMYRGGSIMRDRSHGLYKQLVAESLGKFNPEYLVAMTQNPRVYETLRSFSPSGQAYPASGIENPEHIQRIAERFCEKKPFDTVSLVIRGLYDDIRKDPAFKHARDSHIGGFFSQVLGENDGFFVVVPLS